MDSNKISYREATSMDSKFLFSLANDSESRQNSLNSDPIEWETHQAWFANKLTSPEQCRIFIFENTQKTAVGVLRFQRDNSKALISSSVEKSFRGHGIGNKLIELSQNIIIEYWEDLTHLIAKVKPTNNASIKIFERNKFILKEENKEYIFEKEIST